MTDASPALRGLHKRFGGMIERQPFEFVDGKIYNIDNTKSGVVLISFVDKLSDDTSLQNVMVIHRSDFEYQVNNFLEKTLPKISQSKSVHSRLNVNLEPSSEDEINFEIQEFYNLLLSLEKVGFKHTHGCIKIEHSVLSETQKVDIDFWSDIDNKSTLISSSTITPKGEGIVLCVSLMIQQMNSLFTLAEIKPSKDRG